MTEVSVVIPTRDRKGLLAQTLASVLAQRDVDIEVLVADDGSTDGTQELVAGLGDPRVRVLAADTSQGPAAARNRGAAASAGHWVAFVDDDDLWAPEKLSAQMHVARGTGCPWVYTGAVSVEDRGRGLKIVYGDRPRPPEKVRALLPYRNAVPGGCSNIIVERELFDRVGGFDRRLRHKADWDLYIRLAFAAAPAAVPQPLVAYRLHRGQMSVAVAGNLAEAQAIDRSYAEQRGGEPIDWASVYRYLGWLCVRSGRRGLALRAYGGAVRHGDARAALLAVLSVARQADGSGGLLRRRANPQWSARAQVWLDRVPLSGSDVAER